MEHPHEPVDVIAAWQEWYRRNRNVPLIETPPTTQDNQQEQEETDDAQKN